MSSNNWWKERASREWLYDELGLHPLVKRRWRNKLVFFYKIVNRLPPDYFFSYLDFSSQENYLLRSLLASIARSVPTRTKSFKGTFFPYYINECSKRKVGKVVVNSMLNQLTSYKDLL